jgi:hypothetical protein
LTQVRLDDLAEKKFRNYRRSSRQRSSDASLLKRPEAAHQRNRRLYDENDELRRQLAEVLGRLRRCP